MTDYERGYEQGKADAMKNFDQVEKVMTAFWNLQRQWVGLTDEEIFTLQDFAYADDIEFVRHIEAKLKEKNA
jgi:hypothetical protein